MSVPSVNPNGLVVRIRRCHRRVPGSIPHVGTTFFDRFKCDFFFILPVNVLFNFSQFSLHSFVFIVMSRFEFETFQSQVFLRYECSSKSVLISVKLNKTTGELSCLFYAELSNFSTVAAVTASDS